MALQSSGQISLQDIQDEFGGSHPISLSEYYGVDTVPASGEISFNDFYGASAAPLTTPLQSRIDIANGQTAIPGWQLGSRLDAGNAGPWYDVPSGVALRTSNNVYVIGDQGKIFVCSKVFTTSEVSWLEGYLGITVPVIPVTGFTSWTGENYYPHTGSRVVVPICEMTYSGFVKVPAMPSSYSAEVTVSQGQYGPNKDIIRIYCSSTEALFQTTQEDVNYQWVQKYRGLRHFGAGNILQGHWGQTMHLSAEAGGGNSTVGCSVYSHFWGNNWCPGTCAGDPGNYSSFPCHVQMYRLNW